MEKEEKYFSTKMQGGKIKCHGGAFPTPFRCDPNNEIRDHLLFFYIRSGLDGFPCISEDATPKRLGTNQHFPHIVQIFMYEKVDKVYTTETLFRKLGSYVVLKQMIILL